jgi:membrane fusion protein
MSAAASLVLAVALAALIVFGSYTRRVDLNGIILPKSGLMTISVPTSGWVRALAVRDGEAVPEGALLYRLDVDTTIEQGGEQQAIINALIAQRDLLADQIERKQAIAAQDAQQLSRTIANLKAQLQQLADQTQMQQDFNVV